VNKKANHVNTTPIILQKTFKGFIPHQPATVLQTAFHFNYSSHFIPRVYIIEALAIFVLHRVTKVKFQLK